MEARLFNKVHSVHHKLQSQLQSEAGCDCWAARSSTVEVRQPQGWLPCYELVWVCWRHKWSSCYRWHACQWSWPVRTTNCPSTERSSSYLSPCQTYAYYDQPVACAFACIVPFTASVWDSRCICTCVSWVCKQSCSSSRSELVTGQRWVAEIFTATHNHYYMATICFAARSVVHLLWSIPPLLALHFLDEPELPFPLYQIELPCRRNPKLSRYILLACPAVNRLHLCWSRRTDLSFVYR